MHTKTDANLHLFLYLFYLLVSNNLLTNSILYMKTAVAALSIAVLLSGCYASTHKVGTGGRQDAKPGRFDGRKKEWYLLTGLIPLNKNAPELALQRAGNPENYTMRVTHSFGDLCICWITWGIACPKTIRISKGQ